MSQRRRRLPSANVRLGRTQRDPRGPPARGPIADRVPRRLAQAAVGARKHLCPQPSASGSNASTTGATTPAMSAATWVASSATSSSPLRSPSRCSAAASTNALSRVSRSRIAASECFTWSSWFLLRSIAVSARAVALLASACSAVAVFAEDAAAEIVVGLTAARCGDAADGSTAPVATAAVRESAAAARTRVMAIDIKSVGRGRGQCASRAIPDYGGDSSTPRGAGLPSNDWWEYGCSA